MFGLPFVIVVIVGTRDSILDFFDYDLVTFSNNRACIDAFNALRILEDSPANVVTMEIDIGEMACVKRFTISTKSATTSPKSHLQASLTMNWSSSVIFIRLICTGHETP
jgi:hypothetical protein